MNLIFRDRPLSSYNTASTLRNACLDSSDSLDALLRTFLVLCMLTALLICGWTVNAAPNARASSASPAAVAACGFCVDGRHTF